MILFSRNTTEDDRRVYVRVNRQLITEQYSRIKVSGRLLLVSQFGNFLVYVIRPVLGKTRENSGVLNCVFHARKIAPTVSCFV